MNAVEMLAAHKECWDMPTLAVKHPEVIEFLSAKYQIVFPEDFTGEVYVLTTATGQMTKMGTTDTREAVSSLLAHEVALASVEQASA